MRFEWPDFTRCCFCLPLRRGVLIFGYINFIFSAFMIGVYSYIVNRSGDPVLLYHGALTTGSAAEICLIVYLIEIIFNAVLLYGTHTKKTRFIKAYFYFGVTTVVACLLMQLVEIVSDFRHWFIEIEILAITFAGLCLQVYLLSLIRSLLKKLEFSGSHQFDNQLNQIIDGSSKLGSGNHGIEDLNNSCDI